MMRSLRIIRKLSHKKAIWAFAITLGFFAVSLPRTHQAQNGFFGPVIDEVEPNDFGAPDEIQEIDVFPFVVRGESGGGVFPLYLVFPVRIPPIIDPITGAVVGTPRSTQVIVFINAFVDSTDFYLFRLRDLTHICVHLAEAGGLHDLSGDAESFIFGTILPPSIGPVVVPSDLDVLLFNASTGAFIDGAFDGPGFTLLGAGGAGFTFYPPETLPSDVAQGNPFFVPTLLGRGRYIVQVDDANKFTFFLATFAPGQNILTNEIIYTYEDSVGSPYILRVCDRGPVDAESGNPTSRRAVGAVKFELRYSPTRKIRRAADDYYVFEVINPGTYSIRVGMAPGSKLQQGGHLSLLRYDEADDRWTPVGRSTIIDEQRKLEGLSDVRLESGRYLITMVRDGIRSYGRFNYVITVFDEVGLPVAIQVNKVIPSIEELLEKGAAFVNQ